VYFFNYKIRHLNGKISDTDVRGINFESISHPNATHTVLGCLRMKKTSIVT